MEDSLAYALIQVVHNFGAAAAMGVPFFSLWPVRAAQAVRAKLVRLLWGAWAVQLLSGLLFGSASLYYYGRLPELQLVAAAALFIKIACAALGLVTTTLLVRAISRHEVLPSDAAWWLLSALGAIALVAAAFLRWFS